MADLTITVVGTDSHGNKVMATGSVPVTEPDDELAPQLERRTMRMGAQVASLIAEHSVQGVPAPAKVPLVTQARRSTVYQKFTGGFR